jgi:hypothetical protein
MVTRLACRAPWLGYVIALWCALLAGASCADGLYEPASKPFVLPATRAITITEQGQESQKSDFEEKGCAHFRLTTKQVRSFFRKARTISENDFVHTIDWSPCAVSGTLRFTDGKTADWFITKAGGGKLAISDKREFYLYCKQCGGDKF